LNCEQKLDALIARVDEIYLKVEKNHQYFDIVKLYLNRNEKEIKKITSGEPDSLITKIATFLGVQ